MKYIVVILILIFLGPTLEIQRDQQAYSSIYRTDPSKQPSEPSIGKVSPTDVAIATGISREDRRRNDGTQRKIDHSRSIAKPTQRRTVIWRTAYVSSYGIGDGLLGGRMACGGRLDNKSLIVAYRYLHTKRAELKCGDKIWIRYKNWGPIKVTVRDAGPYASTCNRTGCHPRIFDLSPATCRALHACGIPVIRWRKAK